MDDSRRTPRERRALGRTAAERQKSRPRTDGEQDTISAVYDAASEAASEVDKMLDAYLKRVNR